jgi:hypothetical protein
MRGAQFGLFRALGSLEFCNLAGVGDNIEIARETTDFLAMNAFCSGQIAEDLDQLRIIVGFHLIGQNIVAVDRIDLDLIGNGQ